MSSSQRLGGREGRRELLSTLERPQVILKAGCFSSPGAPSSVLRKRRLKATKSATFDLAKKAVLVHQEPTLPGLRRSLLASPFRVLESWY